MKKNIQDSRALPSAPNLLERGFSLIEVCVAIVILALILTPLYSFLMQQKTQSESLKQEASNEQLLSALAIYVKGNGAYPCPSPLNAAPGDADFGQSKATTVGCASVPGLTKVKGVSGKDIWIGGFPVKTLGLPFGQAVNRTGWKYLYAVTERLTVPNISTNAVCPGKCYDGVGGINIVDAADKPFLPKDSSGVQTYAQFTIINPGDDGKASWSLKGVQSPIACGTTALDHQNCLNDGTFRDAPYAANGDYNDRGYYDDTLSYTLARKESTLWVASDNAGAGGDMNIVNRNMGNVGIGEFNTAAPPTAKLHVNGGNVLVQSNGTAGGNITADKDIQSGTNIRATNDVTAGTGVTAPHFYYCTDPLDPTDPCHVPAP